MDGTGGRHGAQAAVVTRVTWPFLGHARPLAFAHRGGGKERPENTWAAFTHARRLGYRYLETDVHATSDGVVAVIHDPALDRVSDRKGRVGDLRWSEVATARVAGDQPVPRLEELLSAWPDTRWNIDAKHDAVVEPLVTALRRTKALHRVCVTSFSDDRVARLRAVGGPELCTTAGRKAVASLRLASVTGRRPPAGPGWAGAAAVQIPVRFGPVPVADRRFVDYAHRQGLQVHVWTVDDADVMERLLDLEVDGIMTDRPSVLKAVLERRGRWVQPI